MRYFSSARDGWFHARRPGGSVDQMKRLLVISHAPTLATVSLRDAVIAGASDPEFFDGLVEVVAIEALEATDPRAYLDADAYLFGTPVNFGYLSGALKHSFDSTYDGLQGHVRRRPFSYWVHGRSDATGARRALDAITTGLELRLVAEPFERLGDVGDDDLAAAREFGATVAAHLLD